MLKNFIVTQRTGIIYNSDSAAEEKVLDNKVRDVIDSPPHRNAKTVIINVFLLVNNLVIISRVAERFYIAYIHISDINYNTLEHIYRLIYTLLSRYL